ncbi:MAG: adenylate cyclase, class 2 (thermophilic) [halophilic archaeon J07HB67]|nr:MAG: adenylate cyclase, class 2 (thermophilic) [halophilic archaeon J07HB67]
MTDGSYEVEVKVRADHGRLRGALGDHDAESLGGVVQTDTYYDAPNRDFAQTDEALRIRRETDTGGGGGVPDRVGAPGAEPPPVDADTDPDRTKITYKGPLVDEGSKTRAEHETVVGSETELVGVLDGLGYEPAATVEKHRERHAVDGYTVTLDAVTGLGEFVEVEAETDETGIERVRDGARSLLTELGLDPTDQIRTSYLGLLLGGE